MNSRYLAWVMMIAAASSPGPYRRGKPDGSRMTTVQKQAANRKQRDKRKKVKRGK